MFGFLFLKSSDSGLKVKSSSWKTDTKTNVDSQTTLKPHNDMHEAILHHQLLLQKFIHNFLLGKMQMFFFLLSRDYGRALTDREEQTAASWNHNPQLSAAREPRFFSLTVDTCARAYVTKTARFLIRPLWIRSVGALNSGAAAVIQTSARVKVISLCLH